MLGQKLILIRMSGFYGSSQVERDTAIFYNNDNISNTHRSAGSAPDASYVGAPSTSTDSNFNWEYDNI